MMNTMRSEFQTQLSIQAAAIKNKPDDTSHQISSPIQ
jgi:hypothetical protein